MFDIKTPEQARKLAQKSVWAAGLLAIFLTPAAYLYTDRKKIALITLFIWLPLILTDTDNESLSSLLGFLMIGAAIENVVIVLKAKETAKRLGGTSEPNEDFSDLAVTLLKLAQEKGEMTMADCVLKTGKKPEELRRTLLQLEGQDLLRTGNRERDGAVVYRIV
jgi:hypothetical protein